MKEMMHELSEKDLLEVSGGGLVDNALTGVEVLVERVIEPNGLISDVFNELGLNP